MNAPLLCSRAIIQSTPVLMEMVIRQEHVSLLRKVMAEICRYDIEFLFVKSCQVTRMKVCFLVGKHLVDPLMSRIMQKLPSAEFGRYHEVHEQLQKDLEKVYISTDAKAQLYEHTCPICHRQHTVNATMHSVSYGRQLTCSLACESKRREHWWHFKPLKQSS